MFIRAPNLQGSGVRSLLFTFLARGGRPQSAFADGRLKAQLRTPPEDGTTNLPAAGGGDSCSAIGVANRRAETVLAHPPSPRPTSLSGYRQSKGLWRGFGGTCSPQERFPQEEQENTRRGGRADVDDEDPFDFAQGRLDEDEDDYTGVRAHPRNQESVSATAGAG